MAKNKKNTDHCVIRNEKLFCLNCGGEKTIPYPIAIPDFSKTVDSFNKLHGNCKPEYQHPVVDAKLPQHEREKWWLKWGEQGQSSKAIFARLASIDIGSEITINTHKFPHDPDDFRRCHELLNTIPEFRKNLNRMKDISDTWSRLVDNWDKLTELFLDLQQTKKNNGMYDFMQQLIDKK